LPKLTHKLRKLWQSLNRREEPLPKLTYKLPKLWQSLIRRGNFAKADDKLLKLWQSLNHWQSLNQKKQTPFFIRWLPVDGIILKIID